MTYGLPRPPLSDEADSYAFKIWFSRVFGWNQEERGIKSVSAAYAWEAGIRHVRADASAGGFTVSLPPASDFPGRSMTIIKTDSSANTVYLKAADAINGSSVQATASQWGVINVRSTGTTWDKT